jgi:ABC-type molybdate transport system substrate-binding protein
MGNGIAARVVLAAALIAASGAARAEQLRLLSAASVQTVFKEIIGDFESESWVVKAFIAFLKTPQATAVMKSKGMPSTEE